jgi:hypothetical protein
MALAIYRMREVLILIRMDIKAEELNDEPDFFACRAHILEKIFRVLPESNEEEPFMSRSVRGRLIAQGAIEPDTTEEEG